ncbi:hypothetical protein LUZ61_007598 [Rhynchospora tenuis]|uniref:NB-ARC domain-containing protein n=1 Tax=Rhynchospora tenuis TaxID=198213 RepID=A0AAD5ZTW1_9POAL|nr:hypothetical protein LUZ61_007598 [Rhynchospora tenuis]
MHLRSAEVERHFNFKIWLSISQEFKFINILKKMLEKLRKIGSEMQEIKGEEYCLTEIYNFLRDKIYLIVLDDVWSNDLWNQLQTALPNNTNGSRILITTRFKKIGMEADPLSEPHELQFLNEEHSHQLLLKKALPNNDCPDDLLPLANQFAKKCGGLPLALVVLGGILSTRNPDYIIWDRIMKTMDWHTDGSKCVDVISSSYDDLPIHLKPCFLYFALFPEGHQIKAVSLIQMWIAEGFIQEMPTKTMEDTGENYLDELTQRCLVQVSKKSCTGKTKFCHIHDLLRDLAVQKAKEYEFAMVFSKNKTNLNCSSTAPRRAALHFSDNKPIERICTNLRSLIYFQEEIPNCNRFGMLRVLEILGTDSAHNTKWLKGCTSLRYFGFCSVGRSHITSLNVSRLDQLKNLQTVYLQYCRTVSDLPSSFWDNKMLRHVNFSYLGTSPQGPPSSANLENLQTLKWVRARKEWSAKLPHFPQIKKLAITIPEDVAREPIIDLLSNIKVVGSLYLREEGARQLTFPGSTSAFRNHNCLHSLYLNGTWPKKEVDSKLVPPHLIKLTLDYFQFELDPMPQLKKLPNLRVLMLKQATMQLETDRKHMVFSRGGFGQLQKLRITFVSGLEELEIEEGAMPMIKQIVLVGCDQLQVVPDLQYLTTLRELRVGFMNEFKRRLQGEDQWKVAHIVSVTTSYWE